jgi:hypothetical protein
VFTDLRPVFGRSAEAGPQAALVISTLKIEFHRPDGSLDAVFFALDRGDLLELYNVVDRALQNTETLERFIESAELPYWEFVEFDDARAD